MNRGAHLAKRRHEFEEDADDGSMCVCGVPALTHACVEPPPNAVCSCWRLRPDGTHGRGCALSIEPTDRCVKCGGPDGFHDPACVIHPMDHQRSSEPES